MLITKNRTIPIHMGPNTHHHDQLMTWVSLSVMNTMVRSPANPIPPDDDLEVDIGLFFDALQSVYLRRD